MGSNPISLPIFPFSPLNPFLPIGLICPIGPMNPIIRKAQPADLAEISRLNLALFKIQHRFDPTANLDWTFSDNGQKYFKKRISAKDSFAAVAENKPGQLKGYIIGAIIKRQPWRIKAAYAEVESIFVEKKYQGAGLGDKLTRNFINWCLKNKVNYVSLLVAPSNQPAVGFYKKLGFKDYDLVMQLKLVRE